MNTQLVRTTVQLDPQLFKQVKLKMARDGLTFRDLVHTGLTAVVRGEVTEVPTNKRQKKIRFGGHNLGGYKGSLSRNDIYDDVESGVV